MGQNKDPFFRLKEGGNSLRPSWCLPPLARPRLKLSPMTRACTITRTQVSVPPSQASSISSLRTPSLCAEYSHLTL